MKPGEEKPVRPPDRFTLNDVERMSQLWQKIKRHYQERLETLRKKNDSQMPEAQRGVVLGQIQEVKELLSLDGP